MTRSEIKDLIRQAYTNASANATSPVPTPQEEKPSAKARLASGLASIAITGLPSEA
jgi:hypothetical protein